MPIKTSTPATAKKVAPSSHSNNSGNTFPKIIGKSKRKNFAMALRLCVRFCFFGSGWSGLGGLRRSNRLGDCADSILAHADNHIHSRIVKLSTQITSQAPSP